MDLCAKDCSGAMATRAVVTRWQRQEFSFPEIPDEMTAQDFLTAVAEPVMFTNGRRRHSQGYHLQSRRAAVKRTSLVGDIPGVLRMTPQLFVSYRRELRAQLRRPVGPETNRHVSWCQPHFMEDIA